MVHADFVVLCQLQELESSFAHMLGKFGRTLVSHSRLNEAKLFLNRAIGSQEFSDCTEIDELIDQLYRGHHIDPFNIYRIKSLLDIHP